MTLIISLIVAVLFLSVHFLLYWRILQTLEKKNMLDYAIIDFLTDQYKSDLSNYPSITEMMIAEQVKLERERLKEGFNNNPDTIFDGKQKND